jgi:hypothetical protein
MGLISWVFEQLPSNSHWKIQLARRILSANTRKAFITLDVYEFSSTIASAINVQKLCRGFHNDVSDLVD